MDYNIQDPYGIVQGRPVYDTYIFVYMIYNYAVKPLISNPLKSNHPSCGATVLSEIAVCKTHHIYKLW